MPNKSTNIHISSMNMFLGASIAILGACLVSGSSIIMKKLHKKNFTSVSIALLYGAAVGVPFNITLITFSYLLNLHDKERDLLGMDRAELMWQVGLMVVAAIFGLLSIILLLAALRYDEASKIAIVRISDLLFTYILQSLVLGIYANLFSTLGALLILSATLLVMVYKMIEQKYESGKDNEKLEGGKFPMSCFEKIIFFKI